MRVKTLVLVFAVAAVAGLVGVLVAGEGAKSYDVTATAIEACSCPLFCSCYYNEEPSGSHHCQFNNAYKFEEGSNWGGVDLSGAKIWISGDLGGHFGDKKTEWAVVSFDKVLTQEQRDAIGGWIGKTFPVEWTKGVKMREDEIAWTDDEKTAHAKLGSGMAEITLAKVFDPQGAQSTVTNTPYWGTDSNTGFRLAHSTHYYKGEPSYSYEGRNGFVITMNSKGEIE